MSEEKTSSEELANFERQYLMVMLVPSELLVTNTLTLPIPRNITSDANSRKANITFVPDSV